MDSIDRAMAYEAAEREKFERWAKANTPLKFDRDLASYFSGTTQFAWMAWIERALQVDARSAASVLADGHGLLLRSQPASGVHLADEVSVRGAALDAGVLNSLAAAVAPVQNDRLDAHGDAFQESEIATLACLARDARTAEQVAAHGVPEVQAPAGPLRQMAAGIQALDEGHDPLCMAVLRGKECTCGVKGHDHG